DSGIITLGEDGMINRWSLISYNSWAWSKIVDIGITPNYAELDSGMRLAYHKDRVAVSLPTVGVKIWFWSKGSWQAQRPILRPNVTALAFIEDGTTLLGGTVDGVLWACEIPNGLIRACAFLKTKMYHCVQCLISLTNERSSACHGASRLICLQAEKRGRLEQSYMNKDTESSPQRQHNFGACFTARGQGVLFGDIKGCALIWDTKKGSLVYGLDHVPGDEDSGQGMQSQAQYQSLDAPNGGCIVTGTSTGLLSWWSQPAYANSG
ncbi:hypothetical protein F5878DRAFT_527049, partial [Lentinula raphanica]